MDDNKKDQSENSVTVVVNGEPYSVHANEDQQISVIVRRALKQAEQTGRPVEDWELRAGEGDQAQVLDQTKKLRDYGIVLPITLFLNLVTGGGGGA